MIHKIKMAGLIVFAFFSVISYAWAVDYSSMSTEELSKLRGTMQSASQADRDAFHAEWSNRFNQMTPAERENYMSQGTGMGTSRGSGHTGNMDHGNGSGSGNGMGRGGGSGTSGNSSNGSGNSSGSGMGSGSGSGGGGMGNGGGMGMGN